MKQRRVGRRRWAELCRFLTATMKTSRNERIRMQAAMRLADVLTLREQREIAELRAASRTGNDLDTANPLPTEPLPIKAPESAADAARRFLEGLTDAK